MGFGEAIGSVFGGYFDFEGRARRSEYWNWWLFSFIVNIVGSFLSKIGGIAIIVAIFSLAMIIPSWAVLVRRLHDTGRSGWCMFLFCIPLVGQILALLWLTEDSNGGNNAYGPNPKVRISYYDVE